MIHTKIKAEGERKGVRQIKKKYTIT